MVGLKYVYVILSVFLSGGATIQLLHTARHVSDFFVTYN